MLRPFDSDLPLSLLPPATNDKNVDTAQLLEFITCLFNPHIQDGFYVQIWISMGLVITLTIPASFVVARRILQRRAWFLKIWPVASGTFVIPNSVMAFLACQAVFAIAWSAYAYITVQYYRIQAFQRHYFLWKILVWFPLWLGGWWTAFGVLSAFPDALTLKKEGSRPRLILSPLAFNIACYFVPFLQLASILPPAILAARTQNTAFDDFHVWRRAAEFAQRGPIPDAMFSTIHAKALELWLDVTKAYWYMAIAFTCWNVWAFICLLVYVPVGAHTLLRIRQQLKIARTKETLVKPVVHISSARSGSKDAWTLEDPQRGDVVDAATSRVFPSMKAGDARPQVRTTAGKTVEQRRTQTLERLYRNLNVQYYGISVAIICFFASSSVYAIAAYDGARNNKISSINVLGNLSASWSICFFGSLIVLCIFWRSFDPSLSFDVSDEEPLPTAPRSMLFAFKNRAMSLSSVARKAGSDQQNRASLLEAGGSRPGIPASQSLLGYSKEVEEPLSAQSKDSSATLSPTEQAESAQSLAFASSTGLGDDAQTLEDTEPTSAAATEEAYFATPFGKVPFRVHGRVKSDATRSRPSSATTRPKTDVEDYEELNAMHHHRNLLRDHGSMHKPSVSSFGQWRSNCSLSSISSASTLAASQRVSPFSRFETSAPSEIIEMSRSESILEGTGLSPTSSPDAGMPQDLPILDMEGKCLIPSTSRPTSSHRCQAERPSSKEGIEGANPEDAHAEASMQASIAHIVDKTPSTTDI
ncbi:related to conserved hypothetical Ustilaginaceae-specific protein [Ustilago trichophora]|uniref:Related to conserved hypothetical Ustilaginaceae-specific protein n=1 Tax=Ustilago trichophora TaxID=86804 RepID=A0A5C3E461_9BASI|nr:related to conserved hypothetical Ustilaginaceae-specific protein [Ustilago trichophora]